MTEKAATRDASWYRRPNVRTVKVYHIVTDEGLSACRGSLLVYENAIPAIEAPQGLRCQRAGCKGRWPKN